MSNAIRSDEFPVALPTLPPTPTAAVLGALATLPPTPTTADLVDRLEMPPDQLAPILATLEGCGLVERWPDPERPGAVRVMLSHCAVRQLGLALAPRGDHWQGSPAARGRKP